MRRDDSYWPEYPRCKVVLMPARMDRAPPSVMLEHAASTDRFINLSIDAPDPQATLFLWVLHMDALKINIDIT